MKDWIWRETDLRRLDMDMDMASIMEDILDKVMIMGDIRIKLIGKLKTSG